MLNEILFIGNLTKKPELRTVQKKNGEDTVVSTLTVAVDRRKASLPLDGTDFFDVTVWGKTAENCHNYLDKGSRVLIKGYVVINTSEKDGQKRFFTQFTGQRVTFLSRPNQQSLENSQSNTFNIASNESNNIDFNTIDAPSFNSGAFSPINTDEIPF